MRFKLIIGLGNPDAQYKNTYHNVGHLFIDYLENSNPPAGGLKTDVYMNESGKFVAKAMKKTNAKAEELLIAQDDSDLTIGSYKLSFDRNSAGHKGIQSIMDRLRTKKFWRLRIGIRPKQVKSAVRKKAEEFVLKNIPPANKKILEGVFEKSAAEIF